MKHGHRRIIAGFVILVLAAISFTQAWSAQTEEAGGAGQTGEGGNMAQAPEVQSFADKWGIAPIAPAGMQTDGLLQETVWSQTYGLGSFVTAYANELAEQQTVVKTVYDDTYLYVGIEGTGDGSQEAERLFILLQTDKQSETFYSLPIVITAGEQPISLRYKNFTNGDVRDLNQTIVDLGTNKQVRTKVVKHGTGWTAEAAIPLQAIGMQTVTGETSIQMNAIRYFGIGSSKPLSSWVPIRVSEVVDGNSSSPKRSYYVCVYVSNEGRLGTIHLGQMPRTAAGMSAVPWQLEHPPQLRYSRFAQKQLVFGPNEVEDGTTIHLTWIDPLGQETSLPPATVVTQSSERVVSFTHPAPLENGLYQLRMAMEDSGASVRKETTIVFDRFSLMAAGDQLYPPMAAAGTVTNVTLEPPTAEVAKLLTLVPERVGLHFAGVPHNPGLSSGANNYTWSFANPDVIISTDAQHVTYPNAQYPEDKVLTAVNGRGETVEYPYYEDANQTRYFLSSHLLYLQREYVLKRTKELSLTDPLGAARLLYRFAQVFPSWIPVNDYAKSVQYPVDADSGPPYPYFGGLWGRWSQTELGFFQQLTDAYANVKRTNALDVLANELGVDVDQVIVEEMFQPTMDYYHSFPIIKSNVEVINYTELVSIGKALNDPKYVHEAVELVQQYANSVFMQDGFWKEVSLSYHKDAAQLIETLANLVAGWTDPPSYESPRDGKRFDQLDLFRDLPQISAMLQMRSKLAYPDKKYLPVNDTWAYAVAPQSLDTGSLIIPSGGIAKLTRGTGSLQTQLYMKFSPYYGHDHKDPLNIMLYAQGQELLSDIGYSHTKYRQWTASTLAHNTVVVDSQDAVITRKAQAGGVVKRFETMTDSASFVRVAQPDAYAQTGAYERESWMIGFPDAAEQDSYMLDFFHVTGGNRHEYTLHGDANRTTTFQTPLPLSAYGSYLLDGNPQVTEPASEYETGKVSDGQYYGYLYVRDVQSAPIADGRYTLTMETKQGAVDKANVQVTGFAGQGNNTLFIGQVPSMQSTRTKGTAYDTNTEAVLHKMPKLIVRKDGTALQSQFVTTMEPYAAGASPRIEQVQVLYNNEETGAAVVSVSYGDTEDVILRAPNGAAVPLVVGDMRLEGESGFIRLVNGVVTEMALSGGTLLQKGNAQVHGTGVISGTIDATMRKAAGDPYDALVTQQPVPSTMVGQTVIVTHPDETVHAFTLRAIHTAGNLTQLELEAQDPGFAIAGDGTSKMMYYPHTEWQTGIHTFAIASHQLFSNTQLSGLEMDGSAALAPAFSPDITAYTMLVPHSVDTVRLTPTAVEQHLQIDVNGQTVPSGQQSHSIPLQVGSNPIEIRVTAQNGQTQTYTVTVTRAANAALQSLQFSEGQLTPAFSPEQAAYTVDLFAGVPKIRITPVAVDDAAVVNVNDELVPRGHASQEIKLRIGSNPVVVTVTAPDGLTKTYEIQVNRIPPGKQ